MSFAVKTARYHIPIGQYCNLIAQTIAETITVFFCSVYIRPVEMLRHSQKNPVFEAEIKLSAVACFHFSELVTHSLTQIKVQFQMTFKIVNYLSVKLIFIVYTFSVKVIAPECPTIFLIIVWSTPASANIETQVCLQQCGVRLILSCSINGWK